MQLLKILELEDLHTIIEKILDEISFTATDRAGEKIIINKEYINKNLDNFSKRYRSFKIYFIIFFFLKKYKKLPLPPSSILASFISLIIFIKSAII